MNVTPQATTQAHARFPESTTHQLRTVAVLRNFRSRTAPNPVEADDKPAHQQATSPRGRFTQLDSLRGLAAALVVLHHFQLMSHSAREPIVMLSPHGSVPLFFLLSGFVLAIPYLQGKQRSYLVFLIRRLIRIYCPYLCALALAVAGAARFHHNPGWGEWGDHTWSHPVSWPLVLQHLLLIGNYDSGQYNTAFWSLIQEMRVSLCFPAIFFVIKKLRTRWALAVVVACPLAYQWLNTRCPRIEPTLLTLNYIPIFICGILLARHLGGLNLWYRKLAPSGRTLLALLALVLFSAGHLFQKAPLRGMWRLGDWPTVLGSAGIILISLNSPLVKKLLHSPVPKFMGRVSYSLYLVHGTVLFALTALGWGRLPTGLHFLAYLALSLLFATGFCLAIDEPIAQIGRRFGRALPQARSWSWRTPQAHASTACA